MHYLRARRWASRAARCVGSWSSLWCRTPRYFCICVCLCPFTFKTRVRRRRLLFMNIITNIRCIIKSGVFSVHSTFMVCVQNEELYVSIISERYHDLILFHAQGGVNVGDVDAKVSVSIDYTCTRSTEYTRSYYSFVLTLTPVSSYRTLYVYLYLFNTGTYSYLIHWL